MKHIICFVAVVISNHTAFPMEIADYSTDWRAAFIDKLPIVRSEKWRLELMKIHTFAKQHKKYDIRPLLDLATRGVDLTAVLIEVSQECKRSKIKLVDNSTQDISTFLLWFLDAITKDELYRNLDQNKIKSLLVFIMAHKPDSNYRNKDAGKNVAQYLALIKNSSLCGEIRYLVHHGKLRS